jgi:hypothetical protein
MGTRGALEVTTSWNMLPIPYSIINIMGGDPFNNNTHARPPTPTPLTNQSPEWRASHILGSWARGGQACKFSVPKWKNINVYLCITWPERLGSFLFWKDFQVRAWTRTCNRRTWLEHKLELQIQSKISGDQSLKTKFHHVRAKVFYLGQPNLGPWAWPQVVWGNDQR